MVPKDALLVKPRPEVGEPRPSFLINLKVIVKYVKGGEEVVIDAEGILQCTLPILIL